MGGLLVDGGLVDGREEQSKRVGDACVRGLRNSGKGDLARGEMTATRYHHAQMTTCPHGNHSLHLQKRLVDRPSSTKHLANELLLVCGISHVKHAILAPKHSVPDLCRPF